MASISNKVIGFITTSLVFRIVTAAIVLAVCISADPVSGVGSLRTDGATGFRSVQNVSKLVPLPINSIAPYEPDAFSETAKITAADRAAFDQFGSSVAISGDYAIVGADRDDDNRGAAYIFFRSGDAWSQQEKLIATDGSAGDNFGWSVSINGDTAVVGAYGDDISGADQGSAYVFVRTGTAWGQQQKLVATDGAANDQFGSGVSIEGDTIIVGAFGDDSFRGSAYVFSRTGVSWLQQQKLTATDGISDDDFGWAVSINGESAAICAPRDDGSRGSVYVFVRSGSSWSVQQKLTASDRATLDQFGYSVDISGDHLVAGSVNDAPAGSAYVFNRSGASWSEQQKLGASGATLNDNFGTSVAIDGMTLIVGANSSDDGPATDRGRASIWVRMSQVQTIWMESQQIVAGDGAIGDNFGVSVALSGDTAIIGSYLDDDGLPDSGSAYIFSDPIGNPTPTPTITPTPSPTPSSVIISGRVLRPSGQALANVRVFLTDPEGLRQSVTTGSFGIFNFPNVLTGRTYILTSSSKRYRFAPLSLTPTGNISGLELVGLE